LTVIEQVAVRLESATDVAVIVAVPLATAVTTPVSSTVATELSDDVQVTALFVALAGATAAARLVVSSSSRVALERATAILVGATTACGELVSGV
jgi:hypothetical protein